MRRRTYMAGAGWQATMLAVVGMCAAVHAQTATIAIASPNGGQSWPAGSAQNIAWTSSGLTGNVRIYLYENWTKLEILATTVPIGGSWTWNIPATQTPGTTYRVRVQSLADTGINDYSDAVFTITSTASLTVLTPNGGEIWNPSTAHDITWAATGLPGDVRIYLYTNWTKLGVLASVPAANGSWAWNIPANQTLGTTYRIRVQSLANTDFTDYGDATFSIAAASPLTVIAPNGGEVWTVNTGRNITWTSSGLTGNARIYLYNNWTKLRLLATVPIANGSWTWTIPADETAGTTCRIRVQSAANTTVNDYSNGVFRIDGDYRQEMRDFVQAIGAYARGRVPAFVVIPQNGQELFSLTGEGSGTPATAYLNAIDGTGREDLFYGYTSDNAATPVDVTNLYAGLLDLGMLYGVQPLVTDYCSTHGFMDNSYLWNAQRGYVSFAANHRGLDNIPAYPTTPYNVNAGDVYSLTVAKNFLYLLDPGNYASKTAFLTALRATNYDLLILDAFFDAAALSAADVLSLKTKANGGARMVVSYMSIGEAESYRYYWQSSWNMSPPAWMAGENPDWPGNFKVLYWDPQWQAIVYGTDNSYLGRILNAGFDGVYLDIIDAFEYFESLP